MGAGIDWANAGSLAPATQGYSDTVGSQGFNYQPFMGLGSGGSSQDQGTNPGFFGEGGGFGQGMGKLGDMFSSEGFGQGISAFSTLANIYGGFKSLGLAKKQFGFQKKAFNLNFNASAQDYNNTLKDRWAARNASAEAGGQTYPGMNDWLSGRTIAQTGNKAGGNTGG